MHDLAAIRHRHPCVAHMGDQELGELMTVLTALAEQTVDQIIKDHRSRSMREVKTIGQPRSGRELEAHHA